MKKSQQLKEKINKFLWDGKSESYYNIDTKTKKFIRRDTYSNMIPLWGKVASGKMAKAMIKKYIINPQKMWGKFGYRTLAKDDPEYNQANIIKPYSNWQGPVWPIANSFCFFALVNYDFYEYAREIAQKMVNLCLKDIEKSGGMHENYNAETGKPLVAPNFISWNLLVGQMSDQIKNKKNPFDI